MSGRSWDAIVVGAGPAGCAAAYDLAALGRRVLLLDRAEFPRPKACAGGLTMKAVRALRYPIDPVVRLWMRSITLEGPQGQRKSLGRHAPVCAMTVREELDSFCLAKTRERGVVFRRIGAIAAVEQGEGGAVLRCANGESHAGRFLVGADGVHSAVRARIAPGARAAEGGWFRKGFALEANVPYRSAEERYALTFDFAPVARGYGWLFPRDNHVNVGLYTDGSGESAEVSVEAAQGQWTRLDRAALAAYIAARCGADREVSPVGGQFLGLGAADYRPDAGARVLLAGDAAGFVDPLTGEGIYGAIRSGQAAAAAIHAALGGAPAAKGFEKASAALRDDLRVAEHAAQRFYEVPSRGFDLLRTPLLPRVVLHAYAEGMSLARLLRGVRLARRLTIGARRG